MGKMKAFVAVLSLLAAVSAAPRDAKQLVLNYGHAGHGLVAGAYAYPHAYATAPLAHATYAHPAPIVHAPIAVNPYDFAGQVYPLAEPYIHEEVAAEAYVHEDIAAEPYVHADVVAEPYVHVDPAYVHTVAAPVPYVHTVAAPAAPVVHHVAAAPA